MKCCKYFRPLWCYQSSGSIHEVYCFHCLYLLVRESERTEYKYLITSLGKSQDTGSVQLRGSRLGDFAQRLHFQVQPAGSPQEKRLGKPGPGGRG